MTMRYRIARALADHPQLRNVAVRWLWLLLGLVLSWRIKYIDIGPEAKLLAFSLAGVVNVWLAYRLMKALQEASRQKRPHANTIYEC
ncbi:hypothetical protein OPIT5_00070 (plasmid) [Opitutaceae bacterium TAV5]|nr:hypothetical protein OPIT5_00070 [Opitutaceae bacterium TAV5]